MYPAHNNVSEKIMDGQDGLLAMKFNVIFEAMSGLYWKWEFMDEVWDWKTKCLQLLE